MTEPLSDEERRILVLDLRNADLADSVMCDDAANEIERLVEEVHKLRKELELAQQPGGMFYD